MIFTRPVTADNWLQAIALRVKPEQASFVPSVTLSLAKAYIRPDGMIYDPCAVYARDLNVMVGFYSFMYKPHDTRVCYVGGFLIDQQYQDRYYGRAAMADFLDMLPKKFPDCEGVYLTVHSDNLAAESFYSHFGFRKTGLVLDGEDAMALILKK